MGQSIVIKLSTLNNVRSFFLDMFLRVECYNTTAPEKHKKKILETNKQKENRKTPHVFFYDCR